MTNKTYPIGSKRNFILDDCKYNITEIRVYHKNRIPIMLCLTILNDNSLEPISGTLIQQYVHSQLLPGTLTGFILDGSI